MENKLIVSETDLSLVEHNYLNKNQLGFLLKRTPTKYLKTRPAKGGGTWTYVSGGYVKKCLNLMFGWDWDFEILEQLILHGEAIVKGRLTCRTAGKVIIKTQFGNKDIMCMKGTDKPLSIGNDLKAAATDCLKKCASELGIAADVYSKDEFQENELVTDESLYDDLVELFDLKSESLVPVDIDNITRIIQTRDVRSYTKAINLLKSK